VVLVQQVWRIDALHVSLAIADNLIFTPDAPKRWTPPADVNKGRQEDTEQIVGLVKRALDDYAVKVERTSPRGEFVQIGTSPAEIFASGLNFQKLIQPQLSGIKRAGYSWKLDGNLRVRMAHDGRSAWAAAIVIQSVGTGRKPQVFPAFRVLWTLTEENGVWNFSSEHQSLALKESFRSASSPEEVAVWKTHKQLIENTKKSIKPGADIGAW
jgi:hypothetical protein